MSIASLQFCIPTAEDGYSLNRLISENPPLDPNSVYCNLLQCTHFADTCVAVKQNNTLVAFTSGYIIPKNPKTLFIWQMVVAPSLRGQGVATKMVTHLLARPLCQSIDTIETTITEENTASLTVFKRFAERNNMTLTISVAFDKNRHFNGHHNTENLIRLEKRVSK